MAILALSAAVSGRGTAGILELNPPEKVLPVLLSARAEGGTWDHPATEKSLTLLHFSDLHGCRENLGRIVEFRDAYAEYIADAVHTGDVVACYMDDVNPWTKVKGAKDIINVVGNHDCWKGHKTWAETDVPYDATAADVYKVIVKPFVRKWNVVQPEGVNDRNSAYHCACYFYKDYPESKVRLVALDGIHYDDAQDEWLSGVLADALAKGYAVMGAQHYFSCTGLSCVDSGFSSGKSIPACGNPGAPQIECTVERVFETVDRFIDAGGVFVCWLSGHDHEDYIGYVTGHERQLQILVDKAGVKDGYMREDRTPGTVNQDSFNLVTVNASKHLLVIQRIGCTRGPGMRSKSLFCYDYVERKITVNE